MMVGGLVVVVGGLVVMVVVVVLLFLSRDIDTISSFILGQFDANRIYRIYRDRESREIRLRERVGR